VGFYVLLFFLDCFAVMLVSRQVLNANKLSLRSICFAVRCHGAQNPLQTLLKHFINLEDEELYYGCW